MKQCRFVAMLLITAALAFSSCGGGGGNDGGSNGNNNGGSGDAVINIAAISGVTPPNFGETPVSTITETDQYTGTVNWSGSPLAFAAATVYTATITLTAKTGYTFNGVSSNFFKVAGATATNITGAGVVTAVFPATGVVPPTVINITAISGVTKPVLGAIPVTAITETAQYAGTVAWDGGWAWSSSFGGQKAYSATITLTAKSGYTLTGVVANSFTVAGATSVVNSADSAVITAVFPATASVTIGDSALGGKVAWILQSGDPGYVAGEQRGLITTVAELSTGIIWAIAAYQNISVPGGTGTVLGTGSSNTDEIIAQNGAGSTYAAGLARACTDGGYRDWFLPSKDELTKLYISKVAVGGYTNYLYWSSSQGNNVSAWHQNFNNGDQYCNTKFTQIRVRAVRYF